MIHSSIILFIYYMILYSIQSGKLATTATGHATSTGHATPTGRATSTGRATPTGVDLVEKIL